MSLGICKVINIIKKYQLVGLLDFYNRVLLSSPRSFCKSGEMIGPLAHLPRSIVKSDMPTKPEPRTTLYSMNLLLAKIATKHEEATDAALLSVCPQKAPYAIARRAPYTIGTSLGHINPALFHTVRQLPSPALFIISITTFLLPRCAVLSAYFLLCLPLQCVQFLATAIRKVLCILVTTSR